MSDFFNGVMRGISTLIGLLMVAMGAVGRDLGTSWRGPSLLEQHANGLL